MYLKEKINTIKRYFNKLNHPTQYFLLAITSMLFLLLYQRLLLSNAQIWIVEYKGVKGILNPFTYNDSMWYLVMAEYGYVDDGMLAFFPMYPILIKLLNFIHIPYAWGGVLISWTCFYLSGLLLCKMLPEKQKKLGMMIYFFSPISMFCFSVYTESLFLLLTLLVWYFYKKEKYLLTGLLAGCAMLTRNSTYYLILFMAGDYVLKNIKAKTLNKNFLFGLLKCGIPSIAIGLSYPLYNMYRTGDILFFMNVQKIYWHRATTFPVNALWHDFIFIFTQKPSIYTIMVIINLTTAGLAIYLSIKYFKKHWIYSLTLLAVLISALSIAVAEPDTPATISLFRYLWGLFPIYFLTTEWLSEHKHQKAIKTFGLLMNCMVTVLLFLKVLIA